MHYLGHSAGTVRVPLAVQSGVLLCAENAGPDFALLHLLVEKPDKPGELQSLVESARLEGQVIVPMYTFGRRILLTTNRGGVQVWELDRSQATQPFRLAAQNTSSVPPNTACYALLDEGRLWVGDRQLTFFELQNSRGQLARKWLNLKNDVFLAPLRRKGPLLVHVRQRAGKTGVSVAASQIGSDASGRKDGEVVWQTELALRTVGQPIGGGQDPRWLTEDGQLFVLNNESIQKGLVLAAQGEVTDPQATPIGSIVPWTNGRAIGFNSAFDRLVLYDAAAAIPLRTIVLDPEAGKLSAQPTLFGKGLVVGTDVGAVQWLDPVTGKALAEPYVASLSPDAQVQWLPAATTSNGDAAIIVDRMGHLFRIKLVDKPKPRLEAERQVELDSRPIVAPVIVGSNLVLISRDASHDRVHRYRADTLEPIDHTDLPGRITWGPKVCGTRVWMQVDSGALLGINEQGESVTTELNDLVFVGEPLAQGSTCLFSTIGGKVMQIEESNGAVQKEFECGVELGSGPTLIQKQLVVSGGDGTLYFIKWDF